MKYYEMHEDAYRQLAEKNYVGWDRQTDVRQLFEHSINQELSKNMPNHFSAVTGKSALDLGCGSGTVGLYLASLGFDVTGYDVSKTAINMAKLNAKTLGLRADFRVRDLNEKAEFGGFDLIVDSSFLHCIVRDGERGQILQTIFNSLNNGGYFFVHTMVQSGDMSHMLSAKHLAFEGDIVYSTGPDRWEMDWIDVQGMRVFPHRRLLTAEKLKKELIGSGFKIVQEEVRSNPGNPDIFMGWLRKA